MTVTFKKASENEYPNCPFCKQVLKEIRYNIECTGGIFSLDGIAENRTFFCPHCKSILGVSFHKNS